MSNQLMTKQFIAEAAIAAFRIVKFGTTDELVVQGAAATDALIGVVEHVAPAIGERCDVVMSGIAEITLGGTVARGGPLTSDATGRAVAAAPAAGSNNRLIGFALASGVVGDVIPVQIAQGSLQG
jgi:hypothetical protein